MTGPMNPPDDYDKFLQSLMEPGPGGSLSAIQQAQLSSARGRSTVDADNINQNIQRLTSLRDKVGPDQQKRIDQLIANLKRQLPGWTRPNTERRDPRENAVRGVVSGLASASPMFADFLLTPLDLMGVDAAERGRRNMQERAAVIREAVDPQGAVAAVADVAGGIAGSSLGYGPIGASIASRLGKISPAFARLTQAAAAGNRVAGATANAVAGVPINLIQAAGIEGPLAEKVKQFFIGTGADVAFGAVHPQSSGPATSKTKPAKDAKQAILAAETLITNANAKAAAEKAAKDLRKEVAKEVAEQWAKANPGKAWKDLPAKDRKALIDAAVAARTPKPPAPAPAATTPPVVNPSTPTQTPTAAQLETIRRQVEAAAARVDRNPTDAQAIQELAGWQKMLDNWTRRAAEATPTPAGSVPFRGSTAYKLWKDALLAGKSVPVRKGKETGEWIVNTQAGEFTVFYDKNSRTWMLQDPPPAPAPAAAPAPTPAAPVGKSVKAAQQATATPSNPIVKEIVQKTALRKRFEEKGLTFDPNKSVADLEEQLAQAATPHEQRLTVDEALAVRPEFVARAKDSPTHAQALAELDQFIASQSGKVPAEAPASNVPEVADAPNQAGIRSIETAPSAVLDNELKALKQINPHETDDAFLTTVASEELFRRGYSLAEVNRLLATKNLGPWLSYPEGITPPKGEEHLSYQAREDRVFGPMPPAATTPDPAALSQQLQTLYKMYRKNGWRPEHYAEMPRPFVILSPEDLNTFATNNMQEMQRIATSPKAPAVRTKNVEPVRKGKEPGEWIVDTDAGEFIIFHDKDSRTWMMQDPRVAGADALRFAGNSRDEAVKAARIIASKPLGDNPKTGQPLKPRDPSPTPNPALPSGTEPSTPPATPAVRSSEPKGKKAPRRGLSQLTDYSTKELNKLDEQLMAKLDKMAKKGENNSQEYIDTVALMERVTAELNAREETTQIVAKEREYAQTPGDELLTLRDKVQAEIDAAKDKPSLELRNTMGAIQREINGRRTGIFRGPDAVEQPVVTPRQEETPVIVDEPVKQIDPKLLNKSPRTLTVDQLRSVISHLNKKIDEETTPDNVKFLQDKLSKYMEELARQDSTPAGPSGEAPLTNASSVAHSPSILHLKNRPGFAYIWRPSASPEEAAKKSRSFMWGLGSGGIFKGVQYLRARWSAMHAEPTSNLLPGRNQVPRATISLEERNPPKVPALTYARHLYSEFINGFYGGYHLMQAMGKQGHPAEMNMSKLGAMMGRYIARTERFLTGAGRLTYELDGEPIEITNATYAEMGLPIPAGTGDAPLPVGQILDMAEGDKEALGELAVAFASLEGAGRGKMPMTKEVAEHIIRTAHPKLIRAAMELRKYNMGLMIAAHKAGRLSLAGLRAMAAEEWYTPFQRIVEDVNTLRSVRAETNVTQPVGLQGRKSGSGSTKVLNPVDATMEMTRRVLRSNEIGQILNAFVDTVDSLPQVVRNEILVEVSNATNPNVASIKTLADKLRKVAKLSVSDAESMMAYITGEAAYGGDKNYKDALIHVYRNGELKTYRLKQPEMFNALKSLSPSEFDAFTRFMGMPARTTSKGIVYHPLFIARMAMIDSFQAYLGSKYGFRPGIDQIRGFWHAFRRSPEYQRLLDVGGPATIQSLVYVDPTKAGAATRNAGARALDTVVKNLKEMNIVEAYKAIALPIAESARVGEYLRALDHGASTLEAAYAAWDVVGNPRMQGAAYSIRALHQMTLFSRPGLAAMDKLVKETGLGPVEPEYNKTRTGQFLKNAGVPARLASGGTLMAKGFAGIFLPTVALWYINKDDEEIRKLRQTPSGQLFWFVRNPYTKEIYKLRKPHVIGQMFGSVAEAWLDETQGTPQADGINMALDGFMQDASFNVLPQLGVVTYGLWANKAPGLNSPLVPNRDERLAPELQGYDRASEVARIVADELKPVSSWVESPTLRRAMSPAGLDYVVRNLTGMLGEDLVQSVGAAVEYSRSGFLPPKEEAPIISRLFAKYPALNVQPITDFYKRDQRVQEVANTVSYIERRNPELLKDYIGQNMLYVVLADTHMKARQEIANMRRAIEDVKNAPDNIISKEMKRKVEKQFVLMIERVANSTNRAAGIAR